MASAVAKRTDHRASRSVSWSVMHGDEELARILQMQEEKDYQDHLAAKEIQCKSDHRLARILSECDSPQQDRLNIDEFQDTGHQTGPPTTSRSATNSTRPTTGVAPQNATVSSLPDSDAEFSDCFEEQNFDELASALEHERNEADELAERQDAAEALVRNDEIAEALQNDEQLNRMLEIEFELSGSIGDVGSVSSNPIVVSPSSTANGVSICTDLSSSGSGMTEYGSVSVDASYGGDWEGEIELESSSIGTPSSNSSLLMSVNMAWNVVGSAVNWVSELLTGATASPSGSSIDHRVTTTHTAVDTEEDLDDEEEDCEEDDGWEDEDSDDIDDFDDDEEDDDENGVFDMIESDMDESDDDNVLLINFGGDAINRGLVQEEINVLPTRTYHTRPSRTVSATAAGAAEAGADENQCQNECQICLSSFADGEVLRTLPCCHQFHSACIDVWLQRNAICPVCRVRIRDEIGCR